MKKKLDPVDSLMKSKMMTDNSFLQYYMNKFNTQKKYISPVFAKLEEQKDLMRP